MPLCIVAVLLPSLWYVYGVKRVSQCTTATLYDRRELSIDIAHGYLCFSTENILDPYPTIMHTPPQPRTSHLTVIYDNAAAGQYPTSSLARFLGDYQSGTTIEAVYRRGFHDGVPDRTFTRSFTLITISPLLLLLSGIPLLLYLKRYRRQRRQARRGFEVIPSTAPDNPVS